MIVRYYIVDDDINIVKILSNIIEEKDLGDIIGHSHDGEKALKEIMQYNPDIVLIDLLMPKLDGNAVVKEMKQIKPTINFIMISQVSDQELISESYKSGIEFFINKPLNKIEVENVINRVAEKIVMERTLNDIRKVVKVANPKEDNSEDIVKRLKCILSMLGMLGERGTNDILSICSFLLENKQEYDENTIDMVGEKIGDNPNTIRQRIRRAIKEGLVNIANTGLEDYYSDIFQQYSSTLFDFKSVKAEMDYIRGKRLTGGKVNINRFFQGLLFLCENPFE